MITDYHAKYYSYDLTKSGGKGVDRIGQSLFNASVDLNPHQVEAALFALRSPLSKGVLLADEVGLGKTIEAGLVLCQFWAERKRHLIVVCPAALRKQWQVELEEKFNLESIILDAKSYRQELRSGKGAPFNTNKIVITSYHYASKMADDLRRINWDLVVIDEAHKLRNSHQQSNKIGQNIRWALENRRKILLTATPLQNSLSELYGLSTLIDGEMFGDLPTFKSLYANVDGDLDDLRARLSEFCNRTLRKDVMEFVRYTARRLITIPFNPTNDEQSFYEAVSKYLQEEEAYAFPKRQRHLMILIVRKLLASSPVALQGTLQAIKERLIAMRDEAGATSVFGADFFDEDEFEEYLDELQSVAGEEFSVPDLEEDTPPAENDDKVIDFKKLQAEIDLVDSFINWSYRMGTDTKTKNLLVALERGWEKMRELGANEKAVIFTESRRSMEYLRDFLEQNGYAGDVVCFSGGGKRDPEAEKIYAEYMAENQLNAAVNTAGSKAIMLRHALIDRFKNKAKILIATEAGAEGINLQFCSLVINYDLPWNPQRIEQRIGRCHRYGQTYDVVVINFLNERNAADKRVYELLAHKFQLFDGIFGASDDVLGKIDNSTGLEMKILQIYNQCRTEEEIKAAFDQLQSELEAAIAEKLQKVRQQVLENFDEDVHRLLKIDYDDALHFLGEYGLKFWKLTQLVLGDRAKFDEDSLSFTLEDPPCLNTAAGLYYWKEKEDIRVKKAIEKSFENGTMYRMNSELGEWCIASAKELSTPCRQLSFNLSDYPAKISVLENLKGKSGYLLLNLLSVNSLDKEDFLLFSGITEQGESISADILEQLFKLDAVAGEEITLETSVTDLLHRNMTLLSTSTQQKSMEENNQLFKNRQEQLSRWAEDQVAVAERNLEQIKRELRAARHEVDVAANLDEQAAATEKVEALERKKRKARMQIDDVEDAAEVKRKAILEELRRKLVQNVQNTTLFTIQWKII